MFNDWQWQAESTPAASPFAVAAAVGGYLTVVWLLSLLIKTPVHVPKGVIVAHNLVLCVGSLAMFLGAAYEALLVRHSVAFSPSRCRPACSSRTGPFPWLAAAVLLPGPPHWSDQAAGFPHQMPSVLRSARLPVNLTGSPINYANRLIRSLITSQSTPDAVVCLPSVVGELRRLKLGALPCRKRACGSRRTG
jgi:hypothetical protein